jgi:triacylglycerol esterase/lipase EstA (alpha/beta hydrolase family)
VHLESEIIRLFGNTAEPLFLLAHSMGGLDCRRVISTSARLKGRIRRLITIATPGKRSLGEVAAGSW